MQRMCIHVPTKPLHRTFPVFFLSILSRVLASCVKGGERKKELKPPYPTISGILHTHTHTSLLWDLQFGDRHLSSQDLRISGRFRVQVYCPSLVLRKLRKRKNETGERPTDLVVTSSPIVCDIADRVCLKNRHSLVFFLFLTTLRFLFFFGRSHECDRRTSSSNALLSPLFF